MNELKNDMWLLLGWSETQWALALAVIHTEKTDTSTLAHVKHEWRRRYNCDPGTIDFIGVERPKVWEWLAELEGNNLLYVK
jgi:hypothetical protein